MPKTKNVASDLLLLDNTMASEELAPDDADDLSSHESLRGFFGADDDDVDDSYAGFSRDFAGWEDPSWESN